MPTIKRTCKRTLLQNFVVVTRTYVIEIYNVEYATCRSNSKVLLTVAYNRAWEARNYNLKCIIFSCS